MECPVCHFKAEKENGFIDIPTATKMDSSFHVSIAVLACPNCGVIMLSPRERERQFEKQFKKKKKQQ